MARTKNAVRRELIVTRYAALREDYPTRVAATAVLAKELNVSVSAVDYYLKAPTPRARQVFSDHIRRKVALMSLPEIKEYARHLGRDWHQLYNIMLAYREGRDSSTEQELQARRDRVSLLGRFDFASAKDLRAFGLTPSQVLTARKALKEKWGMTLLGPNYLIHPKGNKAVDLTYQEQVMVVKYPLNWVQLNAQRIGDNWHQYDEKKSYMDFLQLDDAPRVEPPVQALFDVDDSGDPEDVADPDDYQQA